MQAGSLRTEEIAVALGYSAFGLVWTFLVIPFLLSSDYFASVIPPVAYLVYNVGYIFLFAGIFGVIIGLLTGKMHFGTLIGTGIGSFALYSLTFDMLQPPLAYNPLGQLVTANSGNLENVAVDYVFGWMFQNWFHVSGAELYALLYGAVPILGILLAFALITPQAFIGRFKGGG